MQAPNSAISFGDHNSRGRSRNSKQLVTKRVKIVDKLEEIEEDTDGKWPESRVYLPKGWSIRKGFAK